MTESTRALEAPHGALGGFRMRPGSNERAAHRELATTRRGSRSDEGEGSTRRADGPSFIRARSSGRSARGLGGSRVTRLGLDVGTYRSALVASVTRARAPVPKGASERRGAR